MIALPFLVGSAATTNTELEQFHARTFYRQDGYALKDTLRPGYSAWVSDSEFNPGQLSVPYDYVLFLEGEHELIEDPADPLKSYVYLEDGYGVIFGASNFDRRSPGYGYSIRFKHQAVFPTATPMTPEVPDEPGLISRYSVINLLGQSEMHALVNLECRQYENGFAKYNLYVRRKDGTMAETQEIGIASPVNQEGSPIELFVKILDKEATFSVKPAGEEAVETSIMDDDLYLDDGESIMEFFMPKDPAPGAINLVQHYYDLVIKSVPVMKSN